MIHSESCNRCQRLNTVTFSAEQKGADEVEKTKSLHLSCGRCWKMFATFWGGCLRYFSFSQFHVGCHGAATSAPYS